MSQDWTRISETAARVLRTTQRAAKRPGPQILPLHIGDPDFDTPSFISEALFDAVRAGMTHYAQPLGDPELREALAADVSCRAVGDYTASNVIITNGGSPALNAAILGTVNPGDRVLIPSPTYSLYADATRLAGGVPELLNPTASGDIDFSALAESASGARMIVLCQPGNPTGAIYTRDELEGIAEIAQTYDLLVLSDEAYDHIVFEDSSFVSALEIGALADRLIYCQTFSKTFAMTGWRVGFVVAPSDLIVGIGLVHRTFNGPVNTAVQKAALAAVSANSTWPAERLKDYARRRKTTLDMLAEVNGISYRAPQGAFYVFLRYNQEIPATEMVGHALKFGLGVRSGSEFGPAGEGHIRIAFCVDDMILARGLAVLNQVLNTDPIEASRL